MRHTPYAIRLAKLAFLTLLVALLPMPAQGEEATALTERTVRLAILSDVHYVDPSGIPAEGTQGHVALTHAESAEVRIMEKIDPILTRALDGVVTADPDAVLVSGDLTSNGEYANAQRFAGRLREAKGRLGDGTGIFVVNGNHDMNVSFAAKFTSEGVEAARRIEQQD